ncbi:MAG: hypothetical protein IKY94_11520 [Lachnospiraceae bacterium]|nr:hypothetical protein [Lachnospiraceae bacterium]
MSKESLDFGLNLDLDIADFKEKWKTYEGQIQKTIDSSAFSIRIGDVKGLEALKKQINEIGDVKIKVSRSGYNRDDIDYESDSIKALKAEIKELEDAWASMSREQKYSDQMFKTLTNTASELVKRYQSLQSELREYGATLKDISKTGGSQSSLDSMKRELKDLEIAWGAMSKEQKFSNANNNELTASAQALVNRYKEVADEVRDYGRSLKDIYKEESKMLSVEEQARKLLLEEQQVRERDGALMAEAILLQKEMTQARDADYAALKRQLQAEAELADQQYFTNLRRDAYQGMGQESFSTLQMREYYRVLEESSAKAAEQEAELEQNRKAAWEASVARGEARYRESQRLQSEKQKEIEQINAEYEALKRQLQAEAELANRRLQDSNNQRYASRQRQISEGLRIQQILSQQARTISQINERLAIQRQRLSQATIGSAKYKRIEQDIKALEDRLRRLNGVQRENTNVTNQQTQAYRSQTGVLTGLTQFANAYFSLLGAYRLASNIKEITAEFELQRVSLRALTQDALFADSLFEKIKKTSVVSPYSTKDLVTYTKQLSAYRIENEELYGTMNMLADISAGLGVGMDRLILAFGQVKSASVLRGTELRQFTEAGITLVDELAKKFSALRGEFVSTSEVFDLISNREVPFAMVADIFKDMTSEGGLFYEMQRKQAESLYGVFENVRDNFQLAADEIGQANRELLMDMGKTINIFARNLYGLSHVLLPLISTIGVYQIGLKLAHKSTDLLTASNARLALAETVLAKNTRAATVARRKSLVTLKSAIRANNKYAIALLKANTATNVFTRSLWKLWAAMLKNPITAAIAALTALGSVIYAVVKYESPATRMMKNIKKSVDEVRASAESSASAFDGLMTRLKHANKGSQEYANIVNEINSRYGDFLSNQLKVSDSYDKIANSVRGVKDVLMEKARADAYSAGINTIQTDLTNRLQELYPEIERRFKPVFTIPSISGVFDSVEISEIISSMLSKIRENPELVENSIKLGETLAGLINSALTEKGLDISISRENINTVSSVLRSFTDYGEAISNATRQTEQLDKMVGSLYSTTYASKIEEINEKYAKLEENIRKTTYADDQNGISVKRNADYLDLKVKKLEEIIKVYKDAGQFNLARQYQEELDKLKNVGSGWRSIVDNIIAGNQKMLKFNHKEDEGIFDYVSNLEKKYKELKQQQDQITKGLKADDSTKKRVKEDIETLEKLAKALGYEFKVDEKASSKANRTKLQELRAEFQMVQKIYKEYEDLRKIMGDDAAIDEIKKAYQDVFKIDFLDSTSLKDRLKKILDEVEKYAGELSDEDKNNPLSLLIKKAIGDIDINSLTTKLKNVLEKISDEIDRIELGSDFYEKILGSTGNVDIATKLTMDITGVDVKNGNIRDSLATQLTTILNDETVTSTVDFNIEGSISEDAIKNGTLSIDKIQDAVEKLKEAGKTDIAKTLQDSLNAFIDHNKGLMESLFDLIDEYSDYATKKSVLESQKKSEESIIQGLVQPPKMDQSEWDNIIEQAKTAINKKFGEELFSLDFEEFKKKFAKELSNLDVVSYGVLGKIKEQLEKWLVSDAGTQASESDYKAVLELIEKIESAQSQASPGQMMLEQIGEFFAAAEAYRKAKEDYKKSQTDENKKAMEEANEKRLQAWRGADKSVNDYADALTGAMQSTVDFVDNILSLAEAFGVTFDDDTMEIIDSFRNGFSTAITLVTTLTSVMYALTAAGYQAQAAMWWVLAIGVALGGIFALVDYFVNKDVREAEKIIEGAEKELTKLNRAYERLQEIQEELVGNDWIYNQKRQIDNLQKQINQFNAQLEAEKSKGKKADEDAIDDYTDKVLDAQKEIRELEKEIISEMTGTDLTSAAKDFADAWLDAYLSFDNTMTALKDSFKDMMNEMVRNSMMAKIVQNRLKPVFDAIDNAYSDSILSSEELEAILNLGNAAIEYLDEDLTHLADMLQLRDKLGSGESDLTGIAKGASQASEETMLTVAGIGNSLLYNQVAIKNDVSAMRLLLESKFGPVADIAPEDSQANIGQLLVIQQQAVSHLDAIKNNTEQSALSLSRIEDKLDSVITPIGTTPRKVIATKIQ